jgi:hypothetical protein
VGPYCGSLQVSAATNSSRVPLSRAYEQGEYCWHNFVLSLKRSKVSESLGFWTLSIVRNSKQLGNSMYRKLDLFPSSCEGETPTLLAPLQQVSGLLQAGFLLGWFSTLKTELILSSETSVHIRRYVSEDGNILHFQISW